MVPYKSKSGKQSGVTAYEIGADFIIVEFNHHEKYTYTIRSAGKKNIVAMKALALKCSGLSTFISQNNPPYFKKL